jgi:hypothetical protein
MHCSKSTVHLVTILLTSLLGSYQREEITLVSATECTKTPLATGVPMGSPIQVLTLLKPSMLWAKWCGKWQGDITIG